MQPRLREEYDADLIKANEPTEYKSGHNQFELPCGVCGKTFYVDEETLRRYERNLELDADNQFTCPECEQEYEDSAFE